VSIFSYWNVWGTDNVGKINANGDKFFYIKDHLGSVRVVLNSDNQIVSAIDYDCWGYPLENRSYQSDDIDYKFTGKQRDAETGYDYFGARYYDARIANWTTTDPLFQKRIGNSPYNYVLRNPMILIDIRGMLDDYFVFDESGNYKRTEINDQPDCLVIENSNTNERNFLEFNDNNKDVAWIRQMIDKYEQGRQFLYIKTDEDINNYMEKSGVTNIFSKLCKGPFALINSLRGGSMDYWQSYLGVEMRKDYGIKTGDIIHDGGGFYLFPSCKIVYNAMDAGNFLWGRGMRELGFDYIDVKAGSQIHNFLINQRPDSHFDQAAIKAGYHSK